MGAKLGGEDNEPISDINIVPFVDIILVVLIIFMVTTPIMMKPSFNVSLPKAGAGDQTTPSEFSVTIQRDGTILLNGKATDETTVQNFSKEMSAQKPDIQAIIAADKDVPHGRVVSIIDAIKTGGIKRFAITIDRK